MKRKIFGRFSDSQKFKDYCPLSSLSYDTTRLMMNFLCVTGDCQLKEAILLYLHELIVDMDADELVNSASLQTLLLRVVLWSVEPQSAEVRNVSRPYCSLW